VRETRQADGVTPDTRPCGHSRSPDNTVNRMCRVCSNANQRHRRAVRVSGPQLAFLRSVGVDWAQRPPEPFNRRSAVDWQIIAALFRRGLVRRGRHGWERTADGERYLSELATTPAGGSAT
jgi:hypothetical protein